MRKRRYKSKLGFTFVILILALASIGYSYSAWYDTITVTGTVTTGEWGCYSDETAWARMFDNPDDSTYDFPGSNWATYIIIFQPAETAETFYMYAGQYYRAGELYIWRDADYLYVKYDLDDGTTMSETHLHIATSLDDFPKEGNNPPPGQFDYKNEYDPYVNDDLYMIPWDESWNCKDLYIGAHAVVWSNFGEDCLPCICDC